MADRKEREKREERVVSAQRRVETHAVGGERTSLNLPKGLTFFAPKVTAGKNSVYRINIIPYEVNKGSDKPGGNPYADTGSLHYERTFWVHRGVGGSGDAYCCLSKTFKKACPICEHRAKLTKDPDADEKLIKDLEPKERQLFQVIDLNEPTKGIQLWDISYHLFGKLLDMKAGSEEPDEKHYRTFADFNKGSVLKLTCESKSMGGGKPFLNVADIEFKPRAEPLDADILDLTHDLDALVKEVPYEKLRAIFLQTGEAPEDEPAKPKQAARTPVEDDDTPPPPKKKPPVEDDAPAPKPKAAAFKVGDTVAFEYPEGKKRTGAIIAIHSTKPLAKVEVADRAEPFMVAFTEMSVIPKPSTAAASEDEDAGWDDAPPPPKKKPVVADDDDLPPPKKKPPVVDDDDAPTPPKPRPKPPVDDDF